MTVILASICASTSSRPTGLKCRGLSVGCPGVAGTPCPCRPFGLGDLTSGESKYSDTTSEDTGSSDPTFGEASPSQCSSTRTSGDKGSNRSGDMGSLPMYLFSPTMSPIGDLSQRSGDMGESPGGFGDIG